MSRKPRDAQSPLAAQLETFADYLMRRYTKEEVLTGIKQLLCDLAREDKRYGDMVLDVPGGSLRVAATEKPYVVPIPNMKYYNLHAALPDGTTITGHALMRKIETPFLTLWELAELRLLNIRYPGAAVKLEPCPAEPLRTCPVSAWWLFPLLFFVIWPSLIHASFLASVSNIYFTILGIAILNGVVCRNIAGAIALGVGGVIAAVILMFIYGGLAAMMGWPLSAIVSIGQDAAWTAYILSLALIYAPPVYLRIRERL